MQLNVRMCLYICMYNIHRYVYMDEYVCIHVYMCICTFEVPTCHYGRKERFMIGSLTQVWSFQTVGASNMEPK